MIAAIDAGSPAANAKLQPGDVILSYEGRPLDRSRQLPRLVADTTPNKTVHLIVWREGKEGPVELTVAALNADRPPPSAAPEAEKPKGPPAVDMLGMKLTRLTPESRKQAQIPDSAKGVLITEVPQGSPAYVQGLRGGDLVTAVGAEPVNAPEEIQQKAAAFRKSGRKNVLLRVERDGNTRFIALPGEAS